MDPFGRLKRVGIYQIPDYEVPDFKNDYKTTLKCRACLQTNPQLLFSMTESEIAKIYTELTTIQLSGSDPALEMICKDCKDLLLRFIDFKKMCLTSNENLMGEVKHENASSVADQVVSVTNDLCEVKCEPMDEDDDGGRDFDDGGDSDEDYKAPKKVVTRRKAKVKEKEFVKKVLKKYECNLCGKETTRAGFTKHWRTHSLEALEDRKKMRTICNECGTESWSKWSFRRHWHRFHGPKKVPVYLEEIVCDICGKSVRKDNIRQHKACHTPAAHICPYCSKPFRRRQNLRRHLDKCELPESERNFVCSTCGLKFGTEGNMNMHVKMIHLGMYKKRSKLCKICGDLVQNMTRHMRKHTDERPYKCQLPDCGMSFRHKTTLIRHAHVHAKTRPYNCTMCSQGYYHMDYLRKHMTRVHGILEFPAKGDKPTPAPISVTDKMELTQASHAMGPPPPSMTLNLPAAVAHSVALGTPPPQMVSPPPQMLHQGGGPPQHQQQQHHSPQVHSPY